MKTAIVVDSVCAPTKEQKEKYQYYACRLLTGSGRIEEKNKPDFSPSPNFHF